MKYIIFFLFISSLYSCQEKKIDRGNKCEQLRLKASLYLDKGLPDAQDTKLDSAIYYSELAYQCDSTNVDILETRLSAYSQNRMYKEALETVNKLSSINKLDNSKEAYAFLKVGYFMALDEKGYQDSIKSYYNYVSKKFDEHKDEKNFRSKYPVYFEPKVLLEYYFKGKESALAILNKFPSEYKLDELNDLIRITNTPPKNMILNYLYIKDTIRQTFFLLRKSFNYCKQIRYSRHIEIK